MRALLHFLSTGFATIEVEERIEVQSQSESKTPEAIRLRSERFRNPKPALLDSLHLRDGAHIRIILSNLQTMRGAEWAPLPPFDTVKL
jgi:hypothetical protein